MKKPVVLIILDGWGLAPRGPGNALSLASLPNYNRFKASFPHGKLIASGEPVGLPKAERGNSETGHLNLGAGRIVYQDLPKINLSIADGSFFKNPVFLKAVEHAKKHNSNLHLLGLIGQGGVHSTNDHLFALLQLCSANNFKNKVFLHLFTDGRDSPPSSSLMYLGQVEEEIAKTGVGRIASLTGRYYAMDRDNRWERTQKTYQALTEGLGNTASSCEEAVQKSYENGKTDEFLEPTILLGQNRQPVALIKDNDSVIFFNFRIDRPRQLTEAFVLLDFESHGPITAFDPYAEKYYQKTYPELPKIAKTFQRKKILTNLCFITMTEYEKELPVLAAFPPVPVLACLPRVLAENGLPQLHLAETEKERFVTYYFDGSKEEKNQAEDWIILPSQKVTTYDLKPEMSAMEITKTFLTKFALNYYNFFLINFANPDMVGHTGIIPAGVSACETVDHCLGKIINQVLMNNTTCLITADHGNVEEMINPLTGGVDTEHSTNLVPFIIIDKDYLNNSRELPNGILADVAPTILKLMGIQKPGVMTGRSLI